MSVEERAIQDLRRAELALRNTMFKSASGIANLESAFGRIFDMVERAVKQEPKTAAAALIAYKGLFMVAEDLLRKGCHNLASSCYMAALAHGLPEVAKSLDLMFEGAGPVTDSMLGTGKISIDPHGKGSGAI